MGDNIYQFKVLQNGALPLQLDGQCLPFTEHVCTSVLIWPRDAAIRNDNSVIVDPCFSSRGWRKAVKRLDRLGSSFRDIGHEFVTHEHRDHTPHIPDKRFSVQWTPFSCDGNSSLSGIRCHSCPGHARDLTALIFATEKGECWIVGDAVISKDWLRQWGYFWLNGYNPEEIAQTWRTVAEILSQADIIVPGHGASFEVTRDVLAETLTNWPDARHADLCPDVDVTLRNRLQAFPSIQTGVRNRGRPGV